MKKIKVTTGVFWVEVPEARLTILCGCPADAVKHLMKRGLIVTQEKNGVAFETGPNAILLSDVPIQNERFCNLGEFPILQMLYRQGMILPNHPNNTGVKPMIIGTEEQIRAQTEYIYRGNYGLVSEEEIAAAGISRDQAREMMRVKLRFAFDRIRRTEDLLDTRVVGSDGTELQGGVFLRRTGPNIFEISYGDESASVDLNLHGKDEYEAPYQLGYHDVRSEYFSVVHSGEGDGWDVNRPCMSSILTFQGKVYLIDAGPNIVHNLAALGLSANDIDGIFHTHAHDDHFNGLTVLMRSDHKIKYYSTALVRRSVARKLASLLSVEEDYFELFFDVCDLEFDTWNNIDGLEVCPILSPHPVETNILLFRTLWEKGYRTYAHWADIASLDVLRGMITEDTNKSGISKGYFENVREQYLTPVDLKKIDIGGGLIHGSAEDFADDDTDKIILSHTAQSLTDRQKEIGASASFGMADVLISSDQDFTKSRAFGHLQSYFPTAPAHELRMLLNCSVAFFNPGSLMVKKGEENEYVYFVLSGILDFIATDHGVHNTLSAGSIAGELSGILGTASRGTYRATSRVKALRISCQLYREFLVRNRLMDEMKHNLDLRRFLQGTWLFGEMVSCPVKNRIIAQVQLREWLAGDELKSEGEAELFLVREGGIRIYHGQTQVDTAGAGSFFGGENILFGTSDKLRAVVDQPSTMCHIPASALADVPIIQWKLLEIFGRRIRV